MAMREERSVGIIPVHRGENGAALFCLVRHADGHWGFPKGHQEEGESDEQAARRELREETGIIDIALVPGQTFMENYSFEREGTHYHKTATYYLGFVDSMREATPDDFKKEISELRWLGYEVAEKTLTFPEAKKLLADVWQVVHEHLE